MALPEMLQGESLTRLIQGTALGAVGVMLVGFNWGGWMTGGTVKQMVRDGASAAVIEKLAPMCVTRFRQSPDAATALAELKKVSEWQQDEFITKGKWALTPGSETSDYGVAKACAALLVKG